MKAHGLELLRFFSAFSVLVWHYQHFYVAGKVAYVASEQPLYKYLNFFYNHGSYGVQVFWCLSGFVFCMRYFLRNQGAIKLWNFFVNRFSRLYPLHFSTLLSVALLQYIYHHRYDSYFVYQDNGVKAFIRQVFFISSWFDVWRLSFNGPVWSVSVEIFVYFGFVFLLRLASMFKMASLMVAFFCAVIWFAGVGNEFFECGAYFFVGVLSAILLGSDLPGEKFVGLLCFYCLLLFVFFNIVSEEILLFMLVPLVVILMAILPLKNQRLLGVCDFLGGLTYASYLMHFPLQLAVVLIFGWLGLQVPVLSVWFFVGYLILVFAISAVVFRKFEMPAQRFIRDFALTNHADVMR